MIQKGAKIRVAQVYYPLHVLIINGYIMFVNHSQGQADLGYFFCNESHMIGESDFHFDRCIKYGYLRCIHPTVHHFGLIYCIRHRNFICKCLRRNKFQTKHGNLDTANAYPGSYARLNQLQKSLASRTTGAPRKCSTLA